MAGFLQQLRVLLTLVLRLSNQNVQQIGARNNAFDNIVVDDREHTLFVFDYFFLNFVKLGRRFDKSKLCVHVFSNGDVTRQMIKGFFYDLAGDKPEHFFAAVLSFGNQKCIDIISGQEFSSFFAGDIGVDRNGGG